MGLACPRENVAFRRFTCCAFATVPVPPLCCLLVRQATPVSAADLI